MSLISNVFVPGTGPENANILFVGEAPGEHEEREREPFVGESGKKLMEVLLRHGVSRESVRLDNLCGYRPSSNKFQNLIGSWQLREGVERIHEFIRLHRPNVVCALGNQPLNYLSGLKGNVISAFRGSILTCNGVEGATDVKLIPTFHPSFVLRDPKSYPIFDFDINRVIGDSSFADTRYPEREYIIAPRGIELETAVQECLAANCLAVDIESVKKSLKILCVGFAVSPFKAYVFPYDAIYYSSIVRILMSEVPKVFHYGYFDNLMLAENGIEVNNYIHDTYIGQHVLNPEFPLTLGFITSILTREPYFKHTGRGAIPSDLKSWSDRQNKEELYKYNGKDCCVTYECFLKQQEQMTSDENILQTYRNECDQLEVALHVSRSGMYVDKERRGLLLDALYTQWAKKQLALDMLCNQKVNVKSPKLKELLYDKFGLPTKRKRDGSITTDEDAIVKLIAYAKDRLSTLRRQSSIDEWKFKEAVLRAILEVRGYRQLISNFLLAKTSVDGRIRSVYKAGPETGRWAASKYVDDTGLNAQTFARGSVEIPEQLLHITQDVVSELSEEDEEIEEISEDTAEAA